VLADRRVQILWRHFDEAGWIGIPVARCPRRPSGTRLGRPASDQITTDPTPFFALNGSIVMTEKSVTAEWRANRQQQIPDARMSGLAAVSPSARTGAALPAAACQAGCRRRS